jgi:sigma-B regulation protein RsbU (phosphoserine phosphatase)
LTTIIDGPGTPINTLGSERQIRYKQRLRADSIDISTRQARYNSSRSGISNNAMAIAIMNSIATKTPKPNQQSSGLLQGQWQERLASVVATMREMSLQDDPQAVVRAYGSRMRQLLPVDGWLSLSRRGLEAPWYRITRSNAWNEEVNPWEQKDRLPLLHGGLLADLIYGDEPRLIDDFAPLLAGDDPAFDYLDGFHSLLAVPHYDRGSALNMVISLRRERAAFDPEIFPEWVWVSTLFGRATHNLVLRNEVKQAYEIVERELNVVANIQRSLLPQVLPKIPNLDLAAYYRTSRWAGGDYYDFFALPDGRWGILIADVSGHGTPAAVMMAITHSLAHSLPGPADPPAELLGYVNRKLSHHYTARNEVFVTAFYGVFDPVQRTLTYSSAGHNPPRLKRCRDSAVQSFEEVGGPPLGLLDELEYEQTTLTLLPGDILAFYTDGITEAMDASNVQFGVGRLDRVLDRCHLDPAEIVSAVVKAVDDFSGGQPPEDDQTLLVARVT